MILGLPAGGQLDADAVPQAARLIRGQCWIQPVQQMLGNTLLFGQDGLPRGLGRMGHEHRLDPQSTEQLHHIFQAQAARFERRDGIFDPTGLRPLTVFQEVLAPAPDPMHLFGEVDRLKPS